MISKTQSPLERPVSGITAVEFDDYGKIRRVEVADGVDFHDILAVVKVFNANKWSHPSDAPKAAIAVPETPYHQPDEKVRISD